jgi:hypothetical protein
MYRVNAGTRARNTGYTRHQYADCQPCQNIILHCAPLHFFRAYTTLSPDYDITDFLSQALLA